MLIGALLLGLSCLVEPAVTTALTAPTATGCRVISVTDGDTIRTWCPGRGVERARLMGFDTPEKFSPKCASEYRRAVRATWELRRMLVAAQEIGMVREGEDRFGRALVRMWIDREPVARQIIEKGLARSYDGGRRGSWCL